MLFSQLIEVLLLIYCQYSFPNSEPRFYFQNSLKIVVSKYNIILPFRVKTTSEKIAIFINNNKSNLGSQNSHNSPRYITWFFFFFSWLVLHDGHTSHVNCQIIIHYMKHYSVTLLFPEMDAGQPKIKMRELMEENHISKYSAFQKI